MALGQQGLKDALKETATDAQQKLLTAKIQGMLPSGAVNDAKTNIDKIKDRLDKGRATIAKLEQAAGPAAESLKQTGIVGKLKGSLDTLAGQVPGLSDLVGQTLQKLPGIQNPIAQAITLLSGGVASTAGITDPGGHRCEASAKVQQRIAAAIGEHVSSIPGLMTKSTAAMSTAKQRVDQIQKLISATAAPDAFSNLTNLVNDAIGQTSVSDEISAASAKFAGFLSQADEGNTILDGLEQGQTCCPRCEGQGCLQIKKALFRSGASAVAKCSIAAGCGHCQPDRRYFRSG